MYYNTMALSIVSATSIYISSAIEFIKNPDSDGVDMELSRVAKNKSKDGLLFTNIEKFNKAYQKGEIEKTMGGLLKVQKDMHESGMVVSESVTLLSLLTGFLAGSIPAVAASAVFIGALITLIIPMMHQLTTFYYHMRIKLSEYLELESQIIRLNAEKLKYDRSKSEDEKKKIADKQRKIADKFYNTAQKISIKSTKADKLADAECKDDQNTKYKIDDVSDNMPDSSVIW